MGDSCQFYSVLAQHTIASDAALGAGRSASRIRRSEYCQMALADGLAEEGQRLGGVGRGTPRVSGYRLSIDLPDGANQKTPLSKNNPLRVSPKSLLQLPPSRPPRGAFRDRH